MANPLLGYAANLAGRAVAGVYGVISGAKEADAPSATFDDDVRNRTPLERPKHKGRKAGSSAEKSG